VFDVFNTIPQMQLQRAHPPQLRCHQHHVETEVPRLREGGTSMCLVLRVVAHLPPDILSSWSDRFQQYNFKLQFTTGRDNVVADLLSLCSPRLHLCPGGLRGGPHPAPTLTSPRHSVAQGDDPRISQCPHLHDSVFFNLYLTRQVS
jgi:hypothetical protein